jgi:flavin-dependent dehydrogenase
MESWPFLEYLGLPLSQMKLPLINRLEVTSPSGKVLRAPLKMGGFGISRYELDYRLYKIAEALGVRVLEHCEAQEITNTGGKMQIAWQGGMAQARLVLGAFGKRSKMDVVLQRSYFNKNKPKQNTWMAVKYHRNFTTPTDLISLHNFQDGYCGVSQIENGRTCVCYLTRVSNLEKAGSIQAMEKTILSTNPHLKKVFEESESLFHRPLTIAQVDFSKKSSHEKGMLMVGDSAGLIAPLCGNGMSMALHAGKIAAQVALQRLNGTTNEMASLQRYACLWKKEFSNRLFVGRKLQSIFGNPQVSDLMIRSLKQTPIFTQKLIALTHGQPF